MKDNQTKNDKIQTIIFVVLAAIPIFITGLFVYTHYILPEPVIKDEALINELTEPQKTWIDIFRPQPKEPEQIPEIDLSQLKPGSCLVFEEKYCATGTLLPLSPDLHHSIKAIIDFNVPVGTSIFQLFDGYVEIGAGQHKKGDPKMFDFLAMHQNPEGMSMLNTNIRVEVIAYGLDIVADSESGKEIKRIKRGEVIARVTSTEDIKKYQEQGESFNVRITFQTIDPEIEKQIHQWVKLLTKQ